MVGIVSEDQLAASVAQTSNTWDLTHWICRST